VQFWDHPNDKISPREVTIFWSNDGCVSLNYLGRASRSENS
jgi:hypothetical protein